MNFKQAKNYTPAARSTIDLIVVHDIECPETTHAAEAVAAWFAGRDAPRASAHYCVDLDSIVQCVRDQDVAWHAPGVNSISIGIEHAGYARQTRPEWLDAFSLGMLLRSAELSAGLCIRYNIPIRRVDSDGLLNRARGLCGHIDVTKAFGRSTHWDPGPNFPWELYLQMVTGFKAMQGAALQAAAAPYAGVAETSSR